VNHAADLVSRALAAIAASADLEVLDQVRIQWLGKKGELTAALKALGSLPAAERRAAGQAINAAKEQVQSALDVRRAELERRQVDLQLAAGASMSRFPAAARSAAVFIRSLKRDCASRRCLRAPALIWRWDLRLRTTFITSKPSTFPRTTRPAPCTTPSIFPTVRLLRTHTSPVQIRAMLARGAPLAVIAPGRVYRCDHDLTHSPMFHQLEGLAVGENISFANLKAVLHGFLAAFFERDLAIRLRPSYFPFTEPSAEVDMSCVFCAGSGCRTCKFSGWLEIAGCGMVHPNVLRASNVDPERYTGYAFGAGIDRLAMLRFGVNDLRLFFENDLRFLRQFRAF
jgi:phenylalanyl-tRNA synthetase alpha chain